MEDIFKLYALLEMIAVAHTELLKTRCPRARNGAGARVVEARTQRCVVGLSFARRWDVIGSVRVYLQARGVLHSAMQREL